MSGETFLTVMTLLLAPSFICLGVLMIALTRWMMHDISTTIIEGKARRERVMKKMHDKTG